MLAFCVALWAGRAQALELSLVSEPELALDVHAFVSQGFLVTASNNYLAARSEHGSFAFTEAGINFTKPLTDSFKVGMQLFVGWLGTTGDFNARFDWFYLDYRWRDWLGIRLGRVKLPFGLYNDIADIDAARVPVLLPLSVYPTIESDYLLAATGGEVYGYLRLRAAGALEYRLYGGTLFVPLSSTAAPSPLVITDADVPYIAGGRLMWETPLDGLRLGGSIQALRIDTDVLLTPTATAATVRIPAVLAVASVEYAAHDLLLAAEYSRWRVSADSSNTAVYPNIPAFWRERGYVMASYRVRRWFTPGAYYSVLFPDTDQRGGRENEQLDLAGTLRFDLNAHWLVKLEGHYMHGTAVLDPALNGDTPLGQLPANWALFLFKTTAYF
jgi:hypothetical protein